MIGDWICVVLLIILPAVAFVGMVIDDLKKRKEPKMYVDSNNRCIRCGEIIPEGIQVCPQCQIKYM